MRFMFLILLTTSPVFGSPYDQPTADCLTDVRRACLEEEASVRSAQAAIDQARMPSDNPFRRRPRSIYDQAVATAQEAEQKLAACRQSTEQRRAQRLAALASQSLETLQDMPDGCRMPEEKEALERLRALRRREQAASEAQHQKEVEEGRRAFAEHRSHLAQLRRNPKLMRIALSALVCHLDGNVRQAQKALADYLTHPTGDDDFREHLAEHRIAIAQASRRVKELRLKMRLANMSIQPCSGEVRKIADCIPSEEGGAVSCDDLHLHEMAELSQPEGGSSYCRQEGRWTVCD